MTAPDNENKNSSGEAMPRQPQPLKDDLVETTHQISINGESIQYTVTCGTMVLKEEAVKRDSGGESDGEKPKASIFFIAYTRQDVSDQSARPVTFSFNGGPGSSSVWLHLGVLGPRRVLMDDIGNTLPPPYRLVENEYSLLDKSDLVFIDPVSTGYSRVVSGEKASEFHGFTRDIESVGDFIRLYTTRYHRWASPKFLIGESYGTTRAAGLAGYLQDRHGLYLNGLMLISSVLYFSTLAFDLGNDLPYFLFLPTYTATAWYHRRLPEDLQSRTLRQVLEEVEAFALGEYALGLMRGAALPEEERSRLVERLARYTGLSPEYIRRAGLRLEIFRYVKELLREEQQTVGRLDSRFRGYDRDAAGEHPEFDPSLTNITGPYTAMLNHYVRAELNFESDLPYEILNPKVWPWSYSEHENRYVEVAETLRKAMTVNPFLKVFVGSGYFDLATPYFATIYTLNHLALAENLAENISTSFYEAGHMMYIDKVSLVKLKEDLARFIDRVLS
jgi:carboxypeptidase C (cathepsin A)